MNPAGTIVLCSNVEAGLRDGLLARALISVGSPSEPPPPRSEMSDTRMTAALPIVATRHVSARTIDGRA